MSVLVCGACTARYAVGAERCPQCGADEPREQHEVSAPLLASLTVACLPGHGCRYQGVVRRVMLPQIVPGVIDMPQLVCAGCGAAMATVTNKPEQKEAEDDVPKTTVHTGASHEAAEQELREAVPGEPLPDVPDSAYPEDAEPLDPASGEEESSPGTSSSTSPEKPPTSPKTSGPEDRSPARKTASRSSKARTAAGTAPSTAGDPTASASDTDKD